MEEITAKYAIFLLFMSVSFTECKVPVLNVIEGDVAILNFTYSCNSTRVTLQQGNGAHIYNSEISIPLSSSNLRLRNETDGGETCFLYLTINPVTRDDQGGYILFAYKDGPTQFEDDRILLVVAYPPGKPLCSLSQEHIDPDWVRLQCTAPVGNIKGFIMCYQNGIKIPPLNSPQQHDEILRQTLLAKLGDLVYCCSSVLGRTKDWCECKDSVWDPSQNKQVKSVTDTCTPVSIQYPTSSQHPTEDYDTESTSPTMKSTMNAVKITSQRISSSTAVYGLTAVICFLILSVMFFIAFIVCNLKKHAKKSTKVTIDTV